MRKLIVVFFVFGFFLAGASGGWAQEDLPSPGLLPDNPFYFLKSLKEEVGTFFTFGEAAKAQRLARLAEIRLAEAKALVEKGKPEIAQKAVLRYQNQLEKALAQVERAREKGMDVETILTRVSEATLKHQAVLTEVYEKVPEKAKPAIRWAMKVGIRGHKEALEKIPLQRRKKILERIKEKREKIKERLEKLEEKGVSLPPLPSLKELKGEGSSLEREGLRPPLPFEEKLKPKRKRATPSVIRGKPFFKKEIKKEREEKTEEKTSLGVEEKPPLRLPLRLRLPGREE